MKFFKSLKQFLVKYKHGFILSYFFVYMAWFLYLERTVTTKFTPIYSKLDDHIPFIEYFIIPYFLWFFYIAITIIYFLLTSKHEFYKCCAYLFTGMTVCLFIYTIWPNGHYLRVNPDTLGRSNIFITIISKLYKVDTATNVFPSIHVFNSVGAYLSIIKSESLRRFKGLHLFTFVLTVLICLSTVFLKQHSIMDLFGALLLNLIMYLIVYVPSWRKEPKKVKQALTNVSE